LLCLPCSYACMTPRRLSSSASALFPPFLSDTVQRLCEADIEWKEGGGKGAFVV